MIRMAQVSPRRVLATVVAVCTLTLFAGCTTSSSGSGDPRDSADSPSSGPTGQAGGSPTEVPGSPVTTPVAPPSPGNTSSTVATRTIDKRKPVTLDKTAQAEEGIDVSLTAVKSITAKAQGPGEVSGPALAITVSIKNSTSGQVSLLNTAVTLTASDGSPGSSMTAAPASQFPSELAGGQSATAVLVFTVDKDKRDPVTVEVSVDPRMPTAVFRGEP